VPNAKVFISFKHNRAMMFVATQMKEGLAQRFVDVYRLVDDPMTGAKFTEQMRRGIAGTDAVIALWSELASKSTAVQFEYRTARELRKPIALVRCGVAPRAREVPLPPDWDPDERYEPLDMVTFQPRLWTNTLDPVIHNKVAWDRLLDRLADYARRARDGKIPPHQPSGPL